ncbi:MAG: hypothetical protein NDJ92_09470 [Thermoanaerobaculia bacterium]|nr:hypothetical protein [Thermoanaerobaculia bacterium]
MAEGTLFFLAPLALSLFGLPAAWASPVDRFSPAGRFSAAFVTGVVAFTVWLTILSTAGIRWSAVSVVLPLGGGSLALAVVLARRVPPRSPGGGEPRTLAWILGVASFAIGSGHLALAALTSRATSMDYLYFWGVKALRFARIGGIDASLLAEPFASHMHSNYPPLVPLVYGWGIEVAGALSWQFGLATCAIWLMAAVPLLRDLLAMRLPPDEATMASSFWFLAFALAVPAAYSAGNAEPPLVLFSSVAIAALLSAAPGREGGSARWLALIALAGVLLTKNEGVIVYALIAAGALAGDVLGGLRGAQLSRRAASITIFPLAALGSWLLFEVLHGVPMHDVTREQAGELSLSHAGSVAVEFFRNLDAGSGWIAWALAVAVIAVSWRRWRLLLPAIVPALGILLFLFVYYLHYRGESLGVWVSWTMPRVSLSALGAAIVGAAFASAPEPSSGT